MSRPPIFLTNAACVRAAKKGSAKPETSVCVGPGDHWTIQCRPEPRRGELGRGIVWSLAPDMGSLDSVKKSRLTTLEYRDVYLNGLHYAKNGPPKKDQTPRFMSFELGPGQLVGRTSRFGLVEVQPGDTLTCCCGRKAADAGMCHRVWAAYLLVEAGWLVVLDGQEIEPGKHGLLLERGGG